MGSINQRRIFGPNILNPSNLTFDTVIGTEVKSNSTEQTHNGIASEKCVTLATNQSGLFVVPINASNVPFMAIAYVYAPNNAPMFIGIVKQGWGMASTTSINYFTGKGAWQNVLCFYDGTSTGVTKIGLMVSQQSATAQNFYLSKDVQIRPLRI